MIYGKNFVWLHFPKCAGNKTEKLFKKYYSDDAAIHQDPFDLKFDPTISWHDSIDDRIKKSADTSFKGRLLIVPFRRLPNWLVSRYNFEKKRSPQFQHDPSKLIEGRFLESGGFENHADAYIKRYLPEHILSEYKVKFIRVEYFEDDFKSIFGELIDLGKIPEAEFKSRTNTSSGISVEEVFSDESKIEQAYLKCPKWKKIEEIAYTP